MPIFVKGEKILQRPPSHQQQAREQWDILEAQSQLTYSFTDDVAMEEIPEEEEAFHFSHNHHRHESRQEIVDIYAKEALDYVRGTLSMGGKTPLADELSSVGSVSVNVPRTNMFRTTVRPSLIDTSYRGDPYMSDHLHQESNTMATTSHYKNHLHGYQCQQGHYQRAQISPREIVNTSAYQQTSAVSKERFFARQQEKHDTSRQHQSFIGPTKNSHDDERQDFDGRERGTTPISDRDVIHLEEETYKDAVDEPARTLEDLITLFKNGYRVKLHTFRGRERAFLYLRQDGKTLCLRSDGARKGENSIILNTTIDKIANLEFGRQSQSGFLLSPLTSFSLAVVISESDEGMQHYDLEAASPVQREVLVSTLMIMMDALASDKKKKKETEMRNVERNCVNPLLRGENGTFDQPIICNPSIEPIPCSPSLEADTAAGFKSHIGLATASSIDNGESYQELFRLDQSGSFDQRSQGRAFEGLLSVDSLEYGGNMRGSDNPLLKETSSGEITDHTSNVSVSFIGHTASNVSTSVPVVVARDLERQIQANNGTVDQVAKRKSLPATSTDLLDHNTRDENEETKYIFEQVEDCLFSGSEERPIMIEDEVDPVLLSRRDKIERLFPISDSNSRDESSRQEKEDNKTIEDQSIQRDGTNDSITVENSIVDHMVDMKPRIQLPQCEKVNGIGGWCSDDVCTGTLNDISKTCTGIFESQQHAMVEASSCIDPTLTKEQVAMVEEYITTALGAPNVVYSYFAPGENSLAGSTPLSVNKSVSKEKEEPNPKKFRNRAVRSNAQADRLRILKSEMTFAHALKQSKERSMIRTTQSFDDAKLLPKLADNAAQKLHASPLLESVVNNMMHQWNSTGNPLLPQESTITKEEESVYYDSDPEDSRPRTIHQGPRRLKALDHDECKDKLSRSKALDGFPIEPTKTKLSKKVDDDTVRDIVQSMMNDRLLVLWHPTQSVEQPNRVPVLARLWIESGVYLIDGSFLLPKLSWVNVNGPSHQGVTRMSNHVNKIDLLDICRIRVCNQVDRTKHPFANYRLAWYVETQTDTFLFECETADERERIVYGLKLVVARLASLLMLRDVRAADEFFGLVANGVPGEAPTWATGEKEARDPSTSSIEDVSEEKS